MINMWCKNCIEIFAINSEKLVLSSLEQSNWVINVAVHTVFYCLLSKHLVYHQIHLAHWFTKMSSSIAMRCYDVVIWWLWRTYQKLVFIKQNNSICILNGTGKTADLRYSSGSIWNDQNGHNELYSLFAYCYRFCTQIKTCRQNSACKRMSAICVWMQSQFTMGWCVFNEWI